MTNPDSFTTTLRAAIAPLRKRLEETTEEAQRIQTAIAALEQLIPAPGAPASGADDGLIGGRPSVRAMMLRLLGEEDRDWSVNEILDEYQRRGVTFYVKDPKNALRAAVSESNRDGQITRTSAGRYKATRWATEARSPDFAAMLRTAQSLGDDAPG